VLLGPNGVVIANSIDASWQLRPLVPLRPDVRDALARSGRWGSSPPPEPLGQSGLARAIGVRERTLFPWESERTTYQAIALPLSTTNWTYAAALPVSAFEAPA
jgi:C4-dicarboxylate-specific signal transduction histidine kinase